jgi:hypothetical protein
MGRVSMVRGGQLSGMDFHSANDQSINRTVSLRASFLEQIGDHFFRLVFLEPMKTSSGQVRIIGHPCCLHSMLVRLPCQVQTVELFVMDPMLI